MISKLPRWAWTGGILLTSVAGMINAVAFLSFQHQGVTHLTGSTTLFGIALAQGDARAAWHLAAIAGAFVAGCIASGAIVQDSTLQLGRRYGVALAIESLLLFCAVPLLDRHVTWGAYLASCACGLQNGMASTFSGAVLRTTHVSGAFTDLGIFLGHLLRGMSVDVRRVRLCLVLIGGFLLGSCLGAMGHAWFGNRILYLPASAIGGAGVAYGTYRHFRRSPPLHPG
jgi:uncharacterized membrane protein YoaK (UPF0700 family)